MNINFPKMDCIGMMPPLDLLQTIGFKICVGQDGIGRIPEFDGKTIIDFGAGISDFSNTITQLSSPKRIAAVDVMYQSDEFYDAYVEKTRGFIAAKVGDLHEAVRNDISEDGISQEVMDLYGSIGNRLKRQVRILSKTTHHLPQIEKYTSINEMKSVGKCDYVFATHVLFSLSDRLLGLSLLAMMLQDDGRIFVVDYDRVGVMGECTNVLRREIELGNTGIREIQGIHGDAFFEITKMGAVLAYMREQGIPYG